MFAQACAAELGTARAAVYDVRVLPAEHQLAVSLRFQAPSGISEVDLTLPSWVPGSYWFRTLGRNLFDVAACDARTGRPLPVRRHGWQGHRVEEVAGPVQVSWRVAADDVEYSQLSGIVADDFAVLSAANFLRPSAWRGPCRIGCDLPTGWRVHSTGPARSCHSAGRHCWEYPNYSLMLDSPVVLGRFDRISREDDGTAFHFVFLDRAIGFETGAEAFVDRAMAAARECRKVFGSYPFPSYTFILTTNPDLRWGLEHLASSVCSLGPDVFIDPEVSARGIRTCAHELFHAWNVRRLRPSPFGHPFDLERGSYTEGLWLSEGFTRYYEFLLCVRAGVYSPCDFVSNVVNNWEQLRRRPAYRRVSAADSSLATFLNHRKYANDANTSIDYYQKGMLMAFDLDAELRLAGDSLDAALRDFYAAFAGRGPGYTTEEALGFFLRRNPRAGPGSPERRCVPAVCGAAATGASGIRDPDETVERSVLY